MKLFLAILFQFLLQLPLCIFLAHGVSDVTGVDNIIAVISVSILALILYNASRDEIYPDQ
jgi:hypothetical protein